MAHAAGLLRAWPGRRISAGVPIEQPERTQLPLAQLLSRSC